MLTLPLYLNVCVKLHSKNLHGFSPKTLLFIVKIKPFSKLFWKRICKICSSNANPSLLVAFIFGIEVLNDLKLRDLNDNLSYSWIYLSYVYSPNLFRASFAVYLKGCQYSAVFSAQYWDTGLKSINFRKKEKIWTSILK